MRRIIALIAVLSIAVSARGIAQTNSVPRSRPTPADSVFARARALVVNGNGAAGRLLIDSVVAATEPDTPAYAEALYWRARLAATSDDAERDYKQIVAEYPLSPHSASSLFQLGQLEEARGDREGAATHLHRYLLENPRGPDAAQAELILVRVSFALNDLPRGCVALYRALNAVPDSAVELHNQLSYFSPRCNGVDTTRAGQIASASPSTTGAATPPVATTPATPGTTSSTVPTTPVTARDTTRPAQRDTAASEPTKDSSAISHARGKYTLQVAAYSSKTDAERLVKKLKSRGFDARVVGARKPYRVRIGRYETRAIAQAAAKTLKAKKIDAYVTDIGVDDR